jgi:hypothetical protein
VWLAALCATLAFAPAGLRAGEPFIHETFDANPKGRWSSTAAPDVEGSWDPTNGAAAKPCFRIVEKTDIRSAWFKLPAGCEFLRLTFLNQSEQRGEWTFIFYADKKYLGTPKGGGTYVTGGQWRENEFYNRVPAGATVASLCLSSGGGGKPMWVDDIVVTAATGKEVLAAFDRQQKTLPSFDFFTPAPARFRYLPKTMQKLRAGKEVRCQILGHSYANDFAGSYFDLMVERLYPGATVALLEPIFANSATCRYWEQDNRVKQALEGKEFDLLFLCSLWGELNGSALHSVIRQIRAVSDCEILVTLGPTLSSQFALAPRNPEGFRPIDLVRQKLMQAGEEEKVAIFNLGEVMDNSIVKSGQDLSGFSRDGLHASESGRLLMATIFARWMAPDRKSWLESACLFPGYFHLRQD